MPKRPNRVVRWLKESGPIDLLLVGLGCGLFAKSLYAKPTVAESWEVLEPNVATELLGVFLSVKIIEAWFSRNRDRERTRRTMIDRGLGLYQQLEHFRRYPRAADLTELEQNIRWGTAVFDKRKGNFTASECAAQVEFQGALQEASNRARALFAAGLEQEAAYQPVEHATDRLRKQRNLALRAVADAIDARTSPADATAKSLVDGAQELFSTAEFDALSRKVGASTQGTYVSFGEFHYDAPEWVNDLERAMHKLAHNEEAPDARARALLAEGRTAVTATSTPGCLVVPLGRWLDATEKFIDARHRLAEQVPLVLTKHRAFRDDVLAEYGEDDESLGLAPKA